jgi:hypothetical protein
MAHPPLIISARLNKLESPIMTENGGIGHRHLDVHQLAAITELAVPGDYLKR